MLHAVVVSVFIQEVEYVAVNWHSFLEMFSILVMFADVYVTDA
jgi:hypothetical protein